MFDTKADFIDGMTSGLVRDITLVETKIHEDSSERFATDPQSGIKRQVFVTGDGITILEDKHGNLTEFELDGDYSFAGKRMTVTEGEVTKVYILNAIM